MPKIPPKNKIENVLKFSFTETLIMLCFRGFELYSRWVPLFTALFTNTRTLKFKLLRFSLPSIIITITSNEP